ncbi:hypothetical protein JCM10908_001457 [Rhodotorula pacifica]|uniref:uncharacterized protein n=1 Tax=Rhodotorula pacifica TaxID=1495444 RepID=UPI003180F25D
MLTKLLLLLTSFVTVATAADIRGYGRISCTDTRADGTFFGNDAICTGYASCRRIRSTGAFFCGVQGSTCLQNDVAGTYTVCDNGYCAVTNPSLPIRAGTCVGGFGQEPQPGYSCLGYLAPDPTTNFCGGIGASCVGSGSNPPYNDYGGSFRRMLDQNCVSDYCALPALVCANRVPLNGDCTADPDNSCAPGTMPQVDDDDNCICVSSTTPSQRARARERRTLATLCPQGHTACAVSTGYECIDLTTNLEQCGACAADGGVDCTVIEGVASVGCVDGQCEIWACDDGYLFNSATGECVREA